MTSCVHKICRRTYGQTNMKRALTLAKINHPWNWYNMRMLRSWPTKLPNMNKMRQKTSCIHKMCGRTYGKKNMKRATTLAKINHPWNRHNMRMPRSWPIKIPNMNKMRQMTSCVHKMCEWTYGQTNMKRAITLAKIIHPWNRYTMWMLTLWPTKIPNMNKIKQKTND
jgi:ribosome-binding ATPase YchF (GTP1/OBG family)